MASFDGDEVATDDAGEGSEQVTASEQEPARPGSLTGVTIIVPTRNRADLAESTLSSIVSQRASVPVRVLVSDNSTNGTDSRRLNHLVEQLGATSGAVEVSLIRPDNDLPMGEHWEWARSRAEAVPGTSHVMYLTDRTLLKPGALQALVDVARAHPADVISFNNDRVDDERAPVGVYRQSWSGQLLQVPTQRLLDLSAEMILPQPLPRALNTLIPVIALTRIANRYGSVFDSTAPDFCFCYRHLRSSDHILYLDRALTVMHGLARSNGNSTTKGVASEDTRDFLRHARSMGGIAAGTPLPTVTTTYNVIANEYTAAMHALDHEPRRQLNYRAYVRTLARETDGFVPGPMQAANRHALSEAGVRFGTVARLGRLVAHYLHFLRTLGPVDFVVLSADRLSQARPEDFATKEQAVDSALNDGGRPAAPGRHLRYLRAVRLRGQG